MDVVFYMGRFWKIWIEIFILVFLNFHWINEKRHKTTIGNQLISMYKCERRRRDREIKFKILRVPKKSLGGWHSWVHLDEGGSSFIGSIK
uniref:Uncharacterized protein n=1 Tax=Cucumis melo TaxID=3656 RepID=A0A9I9ECZ9_CUCME